MIEPPKLVWGATNWLAVATTLATVCLVLLLAGYWRAGATRPVRFIAGALKALGVIILALILLEPLFSGTRARPGANQFVVLADNSQSMTLKDRDASRSRGEELKALAPKSAAWLAQLGRDFDLRQFAFDSQLRSLESFETLSFDGKSSELGASLERLLRRYHGRPLAGVILMTDGSATDAEAVERLVSRTTGDAAKATAQKIPAIYPVMLGRQSPPLDISLERVA